MNIIKQLEKNVLIFYLIAVILGLIFHDFSSKLEFLIPYLVFLIIYFSTFKVELEKFSETFKNIKNNFFMLILHFLIMPAALFYILIGLIRVDGLIATGIVFIFTLPTATTNVLYSNLLKGNTPFVLSSLLITSLLSPFVTPSVFYLLTRNIVKFDFFQIFIKMILIVVVPFILSNFTKRSAIYNYVEKYANSYAALSFIIVNFIAAGIIYNSGLLSDINSFTMIALLLIALFLLLFIIIFSIFKKLNGKTYGISLALITVRRNTALGVGIASGIFNPVVITILLLYQYAMDIFGLIIKRFVK